MEPSARRKLTQQLNNNDGFYEEDHEDAVSQHDDHNHYKPAQTEIMKMLIEEG
ncbi:hypothetical protein DAPPUDRAFT_255371 [Daphnia pulex]|uniref:Uncharacterized protein n=1 Tax=Daphnia pulex TaxID=6669 RepID=E9H921_DAPPU|nr:hypothetical protein DAPPUDRAFT_255371 [Daphnia pulex]|eukprot:EFX71711.1 hypothetical protein DAPPUDRAFT_255371 [Daphnia pulex]